MNKIRKAKFMDNKERLQIFLAHLAGILDALIFITSLSYLTSDYRAMVLFSEIFEDY